MKKMLVAAIAVLLSVGASSYAMSNSPEQGNGQVCLTQAPEDDYKEVKLEELGEKVQAAVAEHAKTQDILKLEYSEAKKLARVTLANKETKEVKAILLDEEGKIVEEK
jgi:putative lipase involved disintegration of autophagic bodies